MLGGAPKIGKSWMVLDLCIRIAKGEEIWNLPTKKGTTLYLCLEDPLRRVQERLNKITDEVPPNVFFAVAAGTLTDGLDDQIRNFVSEHPDTVLVAIDTFQIIRNRTADTSYANDYEEVRQIKALARCLFLTRAGATPQEPRSSAQAAIPAIVNWSFSSRRRPVSGILCRIVLKAHSSFCRRR